MLSSRTEENYTAHSMIRTARPREGQVYLGFYAVSSNLSVAGNEFAEIIYVLTKCVPSIDVSRIRKCFIVASDDDTGQKGTREKLTLKKKAHYTVTG